MSPRVRTWIFIVVAAAVLVGGVWYVWRENSQSTPTAQTSLPPLSFGSSSSTPIGAPLGAMNVNDLAAYAPRSLFLDPNAVITVLNGNPAASSTDANEFVGQWQSDTPMVTLFDAYLNYFRDNGWTIVSQAATSGSFHAAQADTASSTVLVTIASINGKSLVTVDYQAR